MGSDRKGSDRRERIRAGSVTAPLPFPCSSLFIRGQLLWLGADGRDSCDREGDQNHDRDKDAQLRRQAGDGGAGAYDGAYEAEEGDGGGHQGLDEQVAGFAPEEEGEREEEDQDVAEHGGGA